MGLSVVSAVEKRVGGSAEFYVVVASLLQVIVCIYTGQVKEQAVVAILDDLSEDESEVI